MTKDRYLVGNRIVNSADHDDTKTVEDYIADHKRMSNEVRQLRSELAGAKEIILEKGKMIEALNEVIAKLKKQLEVKSK